MKKPNDSNPDIKSIEDVELKLAEFNKYNEFFSSNISRESVDKKEEKRIVLVEPLESDYCKDHLEKPPLPKNEKNKNSFYKHTGFGLIVGICSYLVGNDSRISIALSAITALSSWFIFNKKDAYDGKFFTHPILEDKLSNGRIEPLSVNNMKG